MDEVAGLDVALVVFPSEDVGLPVVGLPVVIETFLGDLAGVASVLVFFVDGFDGLGVVLKVFLSEVVGPSVAFVGFSIVIVTFFCEVDGVTSILGMFVDEGDGLAVVLLVFLSEDVGLPVVGLTVVIETFLAELARVVCLLVFFVDGVDGVAVALLVFLFEDVGLPLVLFTFVADVTGVDGVLLELTGVSMRLDGKRITENTTAISLALACEINRSSFSHLSQTYYLY